MGYPRTRWRQRFNSVAVLDGGKVTPERDKVDLPNYGEFDEKRVFHVRRDARTGGDFRGVRIGIPVCEDIWGDLGVCETLAESGAEILLVPNGSPYYRGKTDVRHQVVLRQVIESDLPMIYANQVGGQDELVFDGASFAINADRKLAFQMSQFEETGLDRDDKAAGGRAVVLQQRAGFAIPEARRPITAPACWAARLRQQERLQQRGAGAFGRHRFGDLRGACRRCARRGAAARGDVALCYTSQSSLKDAEDCARALGCRYDTVPIFRSRSRAFWRRLATCSRAPTRVSPKRTCRAARAASS
jgi:NAD+ synthase